ncbi:MAG: trigger factor [Lachnospiraceae bacterium]|nr:trigger factor [Lachnospiraceae bacterium]
MRKKGLAVALGLMIICSMAACGKKDGTETTEAATAGTETAAPETESSETKETEGGETAAAPEMPEYVSAFDLGDISDYVELGEYKGIEVTAMDTQVTDEEVEEELKAQVENSGPSYEQVTEGQVAEGDVANIDFVGKMNGEAFQGGTGENFNLTIGSGQFIPGFEDGLIGKNIGDTVVLDLNFPEEYTVNPDFSGKAVEFTVTINYVQGEELPRELDDAFVERTTDGAYKTVEEYRKYMKTEMEQSKAEEARTGKINAAWEKIEANATFKKESEELISYNYDSQIYQAQSMVSMYGMDMASYLSAMGMTEEQFQKDIRDYAEQSARWQLLVRAVVEAEGLEPTDEEYESGLEKLSEETGMDVETMKSNYSEIMIRDILRQQAVQDFLEETAVEVPAETESSES